MTDSVRFGRSTKRFRAKHKATKENLVCLALGENEPERSAGSAASIPREKNPHQDPDSSQMDENPMAATSP